MTRHTACSKVCEMKNASCLETTLPPIQFRHPGPPLYQQLADQLRQAILDKSLHPGEKLPTLQQMASLCGVARNITAQTTLAYQIHRLSFLNFTNSFSQFIYRYVFESINMPPAEFTYSSHIYQHHIFIFRNLVHIFQMPLL